MRHWIACLLVPALLAGCGAEPVWAPDEAVTRAAYRDTENPPSITLFTVLNNRSGEGAHSALMINASQRVIFDPAGTWWHRTAPERNDLHYGITPTMLKFYIDYHARETYHVDVQTGQEHRIAAIVEKRLPDDRKQGLNDFFGNCGRVFADFPLGVAVHPQRQKVKQVVQVDLPVRLRVRAQRKILAGLLAGNAGFEPLVVQRAGRFLEFVFGLGELFADVSGQLGVRPLTIRARL